MVLRHAHERFKKANTTKANPRRRRQWSARREPAHLTGNVGAAGQADNVLSWTRFPRGTCGRWVLSPCLSSWCFVLCSVPFCFFSSPQCGAAVPCSDLGISSPPFPGLLPRAEGCHATAPDTQHPQHPLSCTPSSPRPRSGARIPRLLSSKPELPPGFCISRRDRPSHIEPKPESSGLESPSLFPHTSRCLVCLPPSTAAFVQKFLRAGGCSMLPGYIHASTDSSEAEPVSPFYRWPTEEGRHSAMAISGSRVPRIRHVPGMAGRTGRLPVPGSSPSGGRA